MIQNQIHSFWFGNAEPPDLVFQCRDSWRRVHPDWEVRIWNLDSLDLPDCPYVSQCIRERRWSKLSNFAQAWVLQQHGGVYLDSDVELFRTLDSFMRYRAFSGHESARYPFTAVWGAERGHPWPSEALDLMLRADSIEQLGNTNTIWMTQLLVERFGATLGRDGFQLLQEDIAVFPSTTFCVRAEDSFATHHFSGSWLPRGSRPFAVVLASRQGALGRLALTEDFLDSVSAIQRGQIPATSMSDPISIRMLLAASTATAFRRLALALLSKRR